MGFSKKNALTTVRVPMSFLHEMKNSETGAVETEEVDVAHIFRLPTTKDRENYQQQVVSVKGRKMKHRSMQASWNLFARTILHVEGYDDLPTKEKQTKKELLKYFSDDIGRIHADEAVMRLLERISSEDSDWEKN